MRVFTGILEIQDDGAGDIMAEQPRKAEGVRPENESDYIEGKKQLGLKLPDNEHARAAIGDTAHGKSCVGVFDFTDGHFLGVAAGCWARMRWQTATHSLQMETSGVRSVATMIFLTWVWSLPQKEHFTTVFFGMVATSGLHPLFFRLSPQIYVSRINLGSEIIQLVSFLILLSE